MRQLNRRELAEHIGKLISDDRNATHGDPHVQFALQCMLADVVEYARVQRQTQGRRDLNSSQRHALTMITTKVSRILAGNPDNQDSWLDLAGYALIGAEASLYNAVREETPTAPAPAPTPEEAETHTLVEALYKEADNGTPNGQVNSRSRKRDLPENGGKSPPLRSGRTRDERRERRREMAQGRRSRKRSDPANL